MKYKTPITLKCIANSLIVFEKGKNYVFAKSIKYKGAYKDKNSIVDVGWNSSFVENKKYFVPIKITSWKKHMGGL